MFIKKPPKKAFAKVLLPKGIKKWLIFFIVLGSCYFVAFNLDIKN
jgi:hypothetical protein